MSRPHWLVSRRYGYGSYEVRVAPRLARRAPKLPHLGPGAPIGALTSLALFAAGLFSIVPRDTDESDVEIVWLSEDPQLELPPVPEPVFEADPPEEIAEEAPSPEEVPVEVAAVVPPPEEKLPEPPVVAEVAQKPTSQPKPKPVTKPQPTRRVSPPPKRTHIAAKPKPAVRPKVRRAAPKPPVRIAKKAPTRPPGDLGAIPTPLVDERLATETVGTARAGRSTRPPAKENPFAGPATPMPDLSAPTFDAPDAGNASTKLASTRQARASAKKARRPSARERSAAQAALAVPAAPLREESAAPEEPVRVARSNRASAPRAENPSRARSANPIELEVPEAREPVLRETAAAAAPTKSVRTKAPRPSARSSRTTRPVARRTRSDLVGVPLASLATCHSDREEDRLKLAVIAASAGRTSCENDAGVFHLVEAKNLNAFLLSIEGARDRKLDDRCTELVNVIQCLQEDR